MRNRNPLGIRRAGGPLRKQSPRLTHVGRSHNSDMNFLESAWAKNGTRATAVPALGTLKRTRRPLWAAARAQIAALMLLTAFAVTSNAAPYEIEVSKSNRLLIVRAGDEVLKVFHVALGRGGSGAKQQLGDKKTPVGTYRVTSFNNRSKFDFFVGLNYPNVKDAFFGLHNEVISRDEFERIISALRAGRLPPQNTALGGAIGIHGIGEETPEKIHIHDQLDWTEGCIALRNKEIHELRAFLGIGTRVVIKE